MKFLDTQSVEHALANLQSHGLTATPSLHQEDQLTVRWRDKSHDFTVVPIKGLRAATAGVTLRQHSSSPDVLLVSDRIVGEVAELARDMQVNYIDASGNAWIAAPDFLIDVQGRRPLTPAAAITSGFTKTELRVALAIMTSKAPESLSTRQLAILTGVSRGATSITIRKLTGKAYLSSHGIRHGEQLLDEWTQAYLVRGGVHKNARQGFVDPDLNVADVLDDLADAQISGELAAERLGWPIRSTTALVYANDPTAVARAVRLRSRGPGRPFEVRSPAVAIKGTLAPSILVRADMLASADPRQIEIAEGALGHDTSLRRLREIA